MLPTDAPLLSQEARWHPISTAPRDEKVFFWIVPRTAEEAYCDTFGRPIVGTFAPYRMASYWTVPWRVRDWLTCAAPDPEAHG